MAKAKVVINEQHSLMEDQYRALRERGFSEIEFVKIPKDGLTKDEQMKLAEELKEEKSIVFASPVPVLMAQLAFWAGAGYGTDKIYVLHNDKREKRELPNGNIVSVVAKEGWELVPIR